MLKKAIHSLKYHHQPEDIAEKLGELLSKTFKLLPTTSYELLTILPIPLHPSRLKSRGFNQSELLTEKMKACLNYKLLTTNYHLLSRTKSTPSQVQSQTRAARLKNLENAFALTGSIHREKTYLLIDDIATTGSTLEQCCKVLKENGAKEVWGLVLARN